jgi:glutathione S-transferase
MEDAMELFASPMACSLASHITALEAGLPVKVRFVKDKKTDDGGDYYGVSALGYVPALRLDDGRVLNENASVLQYLADARPEAGLAPAWGGFERYQLIDTLNYLGTEVHKRIFYQVFSPTPEPAKQAAKALIEPTLDHLARRLDGRDTLVGDRFTVADAYLVTMLNWFAFIGTDLAKWPALQAYHQKHLKRPSVAQAMGVELEERKRRLAA